MEVFLKVVEARSFAGAARLMGRTQPAISQAIARLEEIYGGDLFERRRSVPLALTPIGEAILPSAQIILHTITQQMVRAAESAQGRAGNLRIGFSPGLSAGRLRAGIAEFVAARPMVRLRFVEGFPGELYRRLNECDVDLIIVEFLPALASKIFVQEQLWEERLIAALPAAHPMARLELVSWRNVARLTVLLRSAQGELLAIRDRLHVSGETEVDIQQHEVSRDALLDLVGMGMGATIIPESGIVPHPRVVFRAIEGESSCVRVQAIWRRGDHNPLRHSILAHIRRHRTDGVHGFPLPLKFPATAPAPDRD